MRKKQVGLWLKSRCVSFMCVVLFLLPIVNAVLATNTRFAHNFDDIVSETTLKVNDNTYSDMQKLKVVFNPGEGPLLITGVNYMYNTTGISSTYNMDFKFVGDSSWVGYSDTSIPNVSVESWRNFRCLGPVYLIDDDPSVEFLGMHPSDNCIAISADTPNNGHSYRNTGGGWVQDTNYEYIVELRY
ncbi:MAG: hypothetical protein ACFE9L_00210 [Candidatus Hodarchaeota archaeon]